MEFVTAYCTDVGIRKKTNQDSLLIRQASTDYGAVLFAAVCDGMGGLSKGELASAAAVIALSNWFQQDLPEILYNGLDETNLQQSLHSKLQEINMRIGNYGRRIGVEMGTTITTLLIADNRYFVSNVGDSRVYMLTDSLTQLTHDQTVVQREIDLGRLTQEQADRDPRRSVLLQCVGNSEEVLPEYGSGVLCGHESFLLCSDGFRHAITPQEIYEGLNPDVASTREEMTAALLRLTALNKERQETDNISTAMIHICSENT